MDNLSFTFFETVLIRNELSNKSFMQIADILNKPVDEVAEYATAIAKEEGLNLFGRNSKEKAQASKVKPENKQAVIISRQIEHKQSEQRRKGREPQYETKAFDPSKLIAVKVDEKTIIFIKPGEDAAAARKACLERLNRFKQEAYKPVPIGRKKTTGNGGYFEQKKKSHLITD
jgi:hypothetical protein